MLSPGAGGFGFEAFASSYVNDNASFEDLTGSEEGQAGSGEAGGDERVWFVLECGLYGECGSIATHTCGYDDNVRQAVEVDAFALQGWICGSAFDEACDFTRQSGDDGSHHAPIS